MTKRINVHVRGIGTIGEPLVNMLLALRTMSGVSVAIGKVTFSKASVRGLARVERLVEKGAEFVSDDRQAFSKAGFPCISLSESLAMKRSDVILDCTPTGGAMAFRDKYSEMIADPETRLSRVIAQGSENGFGDTFVSGLARTEQPSSENGLFQVKSCNTHSMSIVASAIASAVGHRKVESLDFTCIRRANDIYQPNGSLSISVSSNEGQHGTHHAEDVKESLVGKGSDTLAYQFKEATVTSRAVKVPTQFMHAISFNMVLEKLELLEDNDTDTESIEDKLFHNEESPILATDLDSSCEVFAVGRDYGFMGRILSGAVLPKKSFNAVQADPETFDGRLQLSGLIFTPQDANTLLSTMTLVLEELMNKNEEESHKVRVESCYNVLKNIFNNFWQDLK